MSENPRIDDLRRRVQADPASIAFAALAEEYRRVGRFDEAIETCTSGLKRHPSYLSAHVTLGRALIEVGRLSDAEEELHLVLRAAPENLAAIRGLADIHSRRREIEHGRQPVFDSPFPVSEPASDFPGSEAVTSVPEPVSWMPPVDDPPPAMSETPAWQPEPEPAAPPIFKFKSAPEPLVEESVTAPSPVVPEPSAFSFANTPSESAIEEWRTKYHEPSTAYQEPSTEYQENPDREPAEPLPDAAVIAALGDFLSAILRARANS